MSYSVIEAEYRERNRLITLEYRPGADVLERHVIKDITLHRYSSAEKARESFEKMTRPKTRQKRAVSTTKPQEGMDPPKKRRGRPPKQGTP